MEKELQIFTSPEFGEIRTIQIDGEPWLVGIDVCNVLGYKKAQNAIATHVDPEDKTTALIQGTGSNYKSQATIINESGFYSLVLSSKLPSAKKFKLWVTREVLPSIRKHGVYATENFIEQTLNDPDYAIRIFTELKKERQRRREAEELVEIQSRQIDDLKTRTTYYDLILACKTPVAVSYIAQDYGMNPIRFNRMLKEFGIQHRVGNSWVLNSKYIESGYVKSCLVSEAHPEFGMLTKWTQKGREFLYYFLKSEGILPKIEL